MTHLLEIYRPAMVDWTTTRNFVLATILPGKKTRIFANRPKLVGNLN